MARQPRQGGGPIERRNGAEGFAWEGIATKVDPAASPPNRPRDLVNVRTQGGDLISRPSFLGEGGFIPLMPEYDLTTPSVDERPQFAVGAVARQVPHWLGDHASAAGTRLWFLYDEDELNGFSHLGFLDTDADRPLQLVASFRHGNFAGPLPFEKYNNEIYVGDHGGLRKIYLVPSREGSETPPVETDRITDDVIISTEPGAVVALQEHEGMLFFVVYNATPGVGEIYTWDGLTVRLEFTMAFDFDFASTAVYKDTLVVAVNNYSGLGVGALLVRDATGTWSTHTLLGFNPRALPNSMAEYGDLLYMTDGSVNHDKIWTWDGSTIALGFTLPLVGPPPGYNADLNVLAKLGGRLYAPYSDEFLTNFGVNLLVIDQDNNLANRYNAEGTRAGVVSTGTGQPIFAMAAYRGRLWLFQRLEGGGRLFWHSQQYVPYDGWQSTDDANGESFTNGSDVLDALFGNPTSFCNNMRTL